MKRRFINRPLRGIRAFTAWVDRIIEAHRDTLEMIVVVMMSLSVISLCIQLEALLLAGPCS